MAFDPFREGQEILRKMGTENILKHMELNSKNKKKYRLHKNTMRRFFLRFSVRLLFIQRA